MDGDRDMKKLVLMIGLSSLLAGCAPQVKPEPDPMSTIDFTKADYGESPSNYQIKIKEWLESNLKDPDSAKVSQPSKPRKEVAFKNKQPIFGYTTCIKVNAKNSYGGYSGPQTYWFFLHKGEIVRAQNVNEYPGAMIFINHFVNCADG